VFFVRTDVEIYAALIQIHSVPVNALIASRARTAALSNDLLAAALRHRDFYFPSVPRTSITLIHLKAGVYDGRDECEEAEKAYE
jgi:hypothetical protein